jgi:hypothetical protein
MNILPSLTKNNTEILLLPAPKPVSVKWYYLAPLLALVGRVFGVLAAAYTEFFHGSVLVAFVGAPIIEEALKPIGVYLMLAKWPRVLRNQAYTAFMSMIAGGATNF